MVKEIMYIAEPINKYPGTYDLPAKVLNKQLKYMQIEFCNKIDTNFSNLLEFILIILCTFRVLKHQQYSFVEYI